MIILKSILVTNNRELASALREWPGNASVVADIQGAESLDVAELSSASYDVHDNVITITFK